MYIDFVIEIVYGEQFDESAVPCTCRVFSDPVCVCMCVTHCARVLCVPFVCR